MVIRDDHLRCYYLDNTRGTSPGKYVRRALQDNELRSKGASSSTSSFLILLLLLPPPPPFSSSHPLLLLHPPSSLPPPLPLSPYVDEKTISDLSRTLVEGSHPRGPLVSEAQFTNHGRAAGLSTRPNRDDQKSSTTATNYAPSLSSFIVGGFLSKCDRTFR